MVYAARAASDLEPAVGDLPTDDERRVLAGQARPYRDDGVVDLRPGPGGVVGEGRWRVPRQLTVNQTRDAAGFAPTSIVLDFRTAVIAYPQVEIGLWTAGAVQLVLPPGGTADTSRVRGPGWPARTPVPSRPAPPAVHLVVHGVVVRRRALLVGYRRLPVWLTTMIT